MKTVQLITPRLLVSGTKGILYHYAPSEGIEGIRRDGVIRCSVNPMKVSVWGTGVYLTSLPESTMVQEFLNKNSDASVLFYSYKQTPLNYYISFRSDDLPDVQKSGKNPDIWLVPHRIDLSSVPHRVYKRQYCSSSNSDRLVNVRSTFTVLRDRSARYVCVVTSYI
jgi:hypothetical protein